jgi:Domain of unknown function (DUF5666)
MTRPTLPSIRQNDRAARDRSRSRRRSPVARVMGLLALGTAAATLAACGSSSSASTTSTTKAPQRGGAAGGAGGRQFPGASGTIAAVSGTSLEVQNPRTGQTTVNYTTTTTFQQTVAASAADVTAGACISAFGKPTSASSSTSRFGIPVTATTVMVSQPTSGSCSPGAGGSGGGGGAAPGAGAPGGGTPGGPTGGRPGGSGRFPGRAAGQFAAASGLVTAVNGLQVTVSEMSRTTGQSTSVAVTLASSTTYSQRTAASPSDLAVGKCAQAVGTADTTGAVTARSITVSTPGANGCTGRFGAGGFGGGGAAGTGPGAGGVAGA